MRFHTRTIIASKLFLVWTMISACGGGSNGGPTPPPPPPPPPPVSALPEGDLIVFGPIPSNGDFTIANVSFSPAAATVTYNEEPSTSSVLQPGHIIAMNGFVDANENITAEALFFDANLIGNIDSVDTASNSLVVMGQPIDIDSDSILSTPLANFSVGEVVQVSGYANDTGAVIASRIDYSVSNAELRLIGQVESLDSTRFRFSVNGLVVDYSQAQMIDTPSGEVTSGMEVLITGGRDPDGTFRALSVTSFDRDVIEFAGSHFRAEGRVTSARAGDDFSINGFPIVIGGQRDYRQGAAADIAVGVAIRLEGNILDDGTAQAHRVWFLDP